MRVLILANIDLGLYKFRRELLEELAKHNEVFFCVPNGEFVAAIEKIGCRFIPCTLLDRHGTNPVRELKLLRFYSDILREIKPDIVFTYTIKCNAYGGLACAKRNIPYVANVTGLGTAVENGGLMQKITLTLYKLGLRKAQRVFFQNEENRDFMLKRGVVRGAYDILPGSGVNLEQYSLCPYPKGETVDFVFVARVMREKGIDQYLEAAKEIRNRHPETRFHIYGFCEQDYENTLKELEEKGIICYHGLVADMAPVYRMAACTVHPTYYPEGMSNVLLESCASGRPVITTDRPGCREIVEDGVNGFLVREKDSADLVEKIEKFLSLSREQRRQMGLHARAKVEREFDREIVIDAYLREIHRVREERRTRESSGKQPPAAG